jgi:hypothetical protein
MTIREIGGFEHPNLTNFKCPICGTSEDKPIALISIAGTEDDGIAQAEQIHIKCLLRSLWIYKDQRMIVGQYLPKE